MSRLPPETTVACPACKAGPGQACLLRNGGPMESCHPSRRHAYLGPYASVTRSVAPGVVRGRTWQQGDLVAVDAKGDFTRAVSEDQVVGVIENEPSKGDAIVKIVPGLESQFGGDAVQISARARTTEPIKAPTKANQRYVHVRAIVLKPLNVIVGPVRGLTDGEIALRKDVKATILRITQRTCGQGGASSEVVEMRIRRWDTDAHAVIVTRAERLVAVDTRPDID